MQPTRKPTTGATQNDLELANAYADLVEIMPWLTQHRDDLRMHLRIDMTILDALLIDLAFTFAADPLASYPIPEALIRIMTMQDFFREKLANAGLPFTLEQSVEELMAEDDQDLEQPRDQDQT